MLSHLLAFSIVFLGDTHEITSGPTPAPLQASFCRGHSEVEYNGAIYYSLEWPVVLPPPGKWVVASLMKEHLGPYKPGTSATSIGAIAIEVRSGRARQLLNSAVPNEFPSVAPWGCYIVPFANNRCGVVFVRKGHRELSRVWEWNLNDDSVTDAGQWPCGLEDLLMAIDRSSCTISWPEREGISWKGTFELVAGTNRLAYSLVPPDSLEKTSLRYTFDADGGWLLPSSSPHGFVVCRGQPYYDIVCEDIQSPKRPKWKLSKQDLCEAAHVDELHILRPLQGLSYPCKRLVFAFEGRDVAPSGKYAQHLGFLVVDPANGNCGQVVPIENEDFLPALTPMVAPSGRHVVYSDYVAGSWKNGRRSPGSEVLYVVDLDQQSFLKLDESPAMFSYPCGFVDDKRFVTADYTTLWLWTCNKQGRWKAQEFFRLGKKCEQ